MRNELIKLSMKVNDAAVQSELETFMDFLSEERIRVSAAGLFRVGPDLLTSVRDWNCSTV